MMWSILRGPVLICLSVAQVNPTIAFSTPGYGKTGVICTQSRTSSIHSGKTRSSLLVLNSYDNDNENQSDENLQKRQELKNELLSLSSTTKRGFYASSEQRTQAKKIIESLASLNPTLEPASTYYTNGDKITTNSEPSIAGKWTLKYTNAPDITSLDPNTSRVPNIVPPNAKLGRIGQECNDEKSTISNVIEWGKPDWLNNIIARTSTDNGSQMNSEDRILQKVVCEAKAYPKEPNIVQLDLVGFELLGETDESDEGAGNDRPKNISPRDLFVKGPAELLKRNPIQLKGPLKAPFGRFEILYLDEEMRIIKTNQGFYVVTIY